MSGHVKLEDCKDSYILTGQNPMALGPGTTLGHCEMGEVWRARDTTLEPEVVIKTLPEGVAKDTGAGLLATISWERSKLSPQKAQSP